MSKAIIENYREKNITKLAKHFQIQIRITTDY